MRTISISLLVAVALTSCAHQQTLYQRIGGTPVLTAITDSFIERFSDDTRVAPTFAKTDIKRFRTLFIEQLCNLTGGGCPYTGRTMVVTHQGMHLTESQFNAIVEDLQDAMAKQRVSIELQNEVIAKLAPLRKDIIHQ